MRKFSSFMAAAVAMLAAVSCNKEINNIDPVTPGADAVVYTAYVDGAETKTSLGAYDEVNDKTAAQWDANDQITIHNGTKGYTFTTTDSGSSATFTTTEEGFAATEVMAVYPAGEYTIDVENKTVNASIPTWQQAQIGTYHSPAALAVAYSEDNTLQFKNATALLKLTVNTDNVTHVYFEGNAQEPLIGDVTLTLNDDAVLVQCTGTENVNKVELYAYHDDANKYFVKGKEYYIAVAPQVFEGGVTVKVRIDEGAELVAKTTTKRVETKANTILDLGVIEYVAPEVTPGEASPWSISGTFNGWGDEPMVTTATAGVFVAEDVTLEAYASFKVRKDKAWTENYGGGIVYFNPNNWMQVYSGGSDISITAAGTYDIYFDYTNKKLYAVTADADYTTVPQQTTEGKEPEVEEPEVTEKTLYLKPNTNWVKDNARFAAYFFNDNGNNNAWVSMIDSDKDGIYEVNIPEGYIEGDNVIFCRMNPNTSANGWGNKWNQTGDLIIPTDGKNLFTVPNGVWDGGTTGWSVK